MEISNQSKKSSLLKNTKTLTPPPPPKKKALFLMITNGEKAISIQLRRNSNEILKFKTKVDDNLRMIKIFSSGFNSKFGHSNAQNDVTRRHNWKPAFLTVLGHNFLLYFSYIQHCSFRPWRPNAFTIKDFIQLFAHTPQSDTFPTFTISLGEDCRIITKLWHWHQK